MNGFFSTSRSGLLSIAIHLAFFAICAVFLTQKQTPSHSTVFIDLVPSPQDRLKKASENQEKPDQRVVQTLPGKKVDQAVPKAFLGEQTQIVDRQTVTSDKMVQIGKSKTTIPAKQASSQQESKAQKTARVKPIAVPVQNLGLALLPTAKELDEMAKQKSDGHDNSNFVAPEDQAPKEYIAGLREGQQTALNTREFMFYGYFQRIRERLDRAWVPILRHNVTLLYEGGRHLASESDYSTKVLVVMNKQGEITRVEVQTESGAHALDDAAVKAFNEAGPFPNPPVGMVDGRGEIRIPWEFILRT